MTHLKSLQQEAVKELHEKQSAYTDGYSEMYVKGEKAGVKGFYLRTGMDGEVDWNVVEAFLTTWLEKAYEAGWKDHRDYIYERPEPDFKFVGIPTIKSSQTGGK